MEREQMDEKGRWTNENGWMGEEREWTQRSTFWPTLDGRIGELRKRMQRRTLTDESRPTFHTSWSSTLSSSMERSGHWARADVDGVEFPVGDPSARASREQAERENAPRGREVGAPPPRPIPSFSRRRRHYRRRRYCRRRRPLSWRGPSPPSLVHVTLLGLDVLLVLLVVAVVVTVVHVVIGLGVVVVVVVVVVVEN